MAPLFSFVVPVRNDARRLQQCLAGIRAGLDGHDAEVIVVDNDSTDDSAEVARAAGVRVVRIGGGPVSRLRNEAARLSCGQWLAFIDADVELPRGWANAAAQVLADPSIWAAGSQYQAPRPASWVQTAYDRLRHRPPGQQAVDWLPSGNLVVRRDAFDRVQGFDESLETCEDVDLCQRLRAAGGHLVSSEGLGSVHHGDPATLKALFLGELWRGRDNLRVSLRVPMTVRSAPGTLIPVLAIGAIIVMLVGLATWAWHGQVAASGGLLLLIVIAAQAGSTLRTPSNRAGLVGVVQSLIISTVYVVARALSLVLRTHHDTRRRG